MRRLILVCVVVVAGAAAALNIERGPSAAGPATGPAAVEQDAGPSAPAEYLTLKWTSGHDVTLAQVKRAERQAAAIPQGSKADWQLVGPSNIGGRIVDLVVDPAHPDTMYTATSG